MIENYWLCTDSIGRISHLRFAVWAFEQWRPPIRPALLRSIAVARALAAAPRNPRYDRNNNNHRWWRRRRRRRKNPFCHRCSTFASRVRRQSARFRRRRHNSPRGSDAVVASDSPRCEVVLTKRRDATTRWSRRWTARVVVWATASPRR